jgi:hypothetical protein
MSQCARCHAVGRHARLRYFHGCRRLESYEIFRNLTIGARHKFNAPRLRPLRGPERQQDDEVSNERSCSPAPPQRTSVARETNRPRAVGFYQFAATCSLAISRPVAALQRSVEQRKPAPASAIPAAGFAAVAQSAYVPTLADLRPAAALASAQRSASPAATEHDRPAQRPPGPTMRAGEDQAAKKSRPTCRRSGTLRRLRNRTNLGRRLCRGRHDRYGETGRYMRHDRTIRHPAWVVLVAGLA